MTNHLGRNEMQIHILIIKEIKKIETHQQNHLQIAKAGNEKIFRESADLCIPWTGKSCFSNRALVEASFEAPKCL